MHRELIIKAFEKMKALHSNETGIVPSNSGTAKLLSDFIFEKQKLAFGERRLSDFHKLASNEVKNEIVIKQPKVVQAMCELLGFQNFAEFSKAYPTKATNTKGLKNIKGKLAKNKTILVLSIVGALIVVLIIISTKQQRWMEWKEDHYEQVKFDAEKLSHGTLKIYKEERIDHFRKLEPDCDYAFFNVDGSVKIWYGKNFKGKLEYFTDVGFHPETGKTLKPITEYMIKKHVCKSD